MLSDFITFKISLSIPFSFLKWLRNWYQIFRKIKFPPKASVGGNLIVYLGDIQPRIKKYDVVLFQNNNEIHRHTQSFNFGEGLPVVIPKNGSAEINFQEYIKNCYNNCQYEPKENNFFAQIVIYFVNGAREKSPKYEVVIV